MADAEQKPAGESEAPAEGEVAEEVAEPEAVEEEAAAKDEVPVEGAPEEPAAEPVTEEGAPEPAPEDAGPAGESVPQDLGQLGSASSFPLKDEAVMKELAEADAKAQRAASLVEHLKDAITDLQKKENLTEEDALEIQAKQAELMEQLAELEAVSKRIQDLLGIQAVSSSGLGAPLQCKDYGVFSDPCRAVKELKSPQLPKVIICGNDSQSQIPKIIVCDPIDKKDAKRPVFQQFPGRPQSSPSPCVDRRGPGATEPSSRGYNTGTGGMQQPGPPFSQGMMGQFPSMQQGQQGFRGPQMGASGQPFYPGQAGIMAQPGMMAQSGMMAQPRMMAQPGMMGQPGMMTQPGMMMQPGMMTQPGMMPQPGMMMQPGMMGQSGRMGPQGMMGQPQGKMSGQFPGMTQSNYKHPMRNPEPSQGMMGGQGGAGPDGGQADDRPLDDLTPTELQKKLQQLQSENKNLTSENMELKKKLASPMAMAGSPMGASKFPEKPICKMTLGKVPVCKLDLYRQMDLPLPSPIQPSDNMVAQGQPMCKRFLASSQPACRLDVYREMGLPFPGLGVAGDATTRDMETMVSSMEEEVLSIKKELDSVQAERRNLELQRKLLQCTAPSLTQGSKIDGSTSAPAIAMQPPPLPPASPLPQPSGNGLQMQLQLRELREQYNKLQQDYRLKVEEVSLLRVELESAKRESLVSLEKTEEAEGKVDELIEKLRAAEAEKQRICTTRDQMIELEQQLIMAKQRYRESSEEAEELKAQLNDQIMQVEEYREKYLKAQETVEEQRRQLDLNEMESNRFGEQVALEIQRVKAQFQAKLEELTPLPEMLKKSQEKLKEALHLKALAEKNVMIMSKNLESANEQKEKLKSQLDEINRNKMASEAEKASLQGNLTDGEKKMEETKAENAKLKAAIARLEDLTLKNERKFEEKVHEALQLQSQLETLREESARQVSRTKDRCENIRRTLLGQISELERQLASARAIAKAAQKDRDDVRQKMQAQITHLNDNFDQAQMRIRNLQSHVNYLKSSYTNIIAPLDVPISIEKLYPDENT